MPGFVKTKKDEKKWEKAKRIAKSKSLSGKKMYAFSNYLFHRMKETNNFEDEKYFNILFERQSECEKMLSPIFKCRYDTRYIRQRVPGSKKFIYKKPDKITVWGCPSSNNYVLG
jgi:hypothetical protein